MYQQIIKKPKTRDDLFQLLKRISFLLYDTEIELSLFEVKNSNESFLFLINNYNFECFKPLLKIESLSTILEFKGRKNDYPRIRNSLSDLVTDLDIKLDLDKNLIHVSIVEKKRESEHIEPFYIEDIKNKEIDFISPIFSKEILRTLNKFILPISNYQTNTSSVIYSSVLPDPIHEKIKFRISQFSFKQIQSIDDSGYSINLDLNNNTKILIRLMEIINAFIILNKRKKESVEGFSALLNIWNLNSLRDLYVSEDHFHRIFKYPNNLKGLYKNIYKSIKIKDELEELLSKLDKGSFFYLAGVEISDIDDFTNRDIIKIENFISNYFTLER